jgi:hypothetical protein
MVAIVTKLLLMIIQITSLQAKRKIAVMEQNSRWNLSSHCVCFNINLDVY